MRLRHFTLHQPSADFQVKPREWKPDPEVSLNHNVLYARAWECDYEQPFFQAKNSNEAPPNPHEIRVQADLPSEKVSNRPGTTH